MLPVTLEPINLEYIDIPKWIHKDVYISYSNIKNAGLGIFAKNDIQAGTFLGEYMGEIVEHFENDDYVMDYYNNKWISGKNINYSNYTRFINCSFDNSSENIIVIDMENDFFYNNKNLKHRKFFFANRLIQKNEELLFYYGDAYAKKLNITYKLKD